MKNLFYTLKRILLQPIQPVFVSLIFIIFGGISILTFIKSDKAVDYFLTLTIIGMSAASVQSTSIQNQIQKDNLKINLFNKRYIIYKTVLDSITFIKRNNWDRYILFNGNDINKQIILIEEELFNAVQSSIFLYDYQTFSKLTTVNNAFCKVAASYKQMIIDNIKNFNSNEEIKEFIELFNFQFLLKSEYNTSQYEQIIQEKFPKTYISIMKFNKSCEEYLHVVQETDILKRLGTYLKVDKLDQ